MRRDVTFQEDSSVREGDMDRSGPTICEQTVDFCLGPDPVPQLVIQSVVSDEAVDFEVEEFSDAHIVSKPPVVEPTLFQAHRLGCTVREY